MLPDMSTGNRPPLACWCESRVEARPGARLQAWMPRLPNFFASEMATARHAQKPSKSRGYGYSREYPVERAYRTPASPEI